MDDEPAPLPTPPEQAPKPKRSLLSDESKAKKSEYDKRRRLAKKQLAVSERPITITTTDVPESVAGLVTCSADKIPPATPIIILTPEEIDIELRARTKAFDNENALAKSTRERYDSDMRAHAAWARKKLSYQDKDTDTPEQRAVKYEQRNAFVPGMPVTRVIAEVVFAYLSEATDPVTNGGKPRLGHSSAGAHRASIKDHFFRCSQARVRPSLSLSVLTPFKGGVMPRGVRQPRWVAFPPPAHSPSLPSNL